MPKAKKLRARKYQTKDIAWLLQNDSSLYAADIGVGKTMVALKVFEERQKAGDVDRCLVVATPRIIEHTWPDEIQKWVPNMTYAVLHGNARKRAKALEEDVDIYLTTYDTLKMIIGDLYDDINMIVFDESHKLKGGRTARFKTVKKHYQSFPYRLLMSGSPMPNSLEDLWSQAYLLDGGASIGKFITHFRNRYCLPHPSGFGYVPREGAEDEIFNELSDLVLRREATKEAGIPEIISNDILVTLPRDALRVYTELEKDFVTQIQNNVVSAYNAGVASMKLRQVVNGFVYDTTGSGREAHHVHSAKLDALAELLEGLQGNPLLVAYVFKQDAVTLRDELGIPSFTGLTGRNARNLLDAWNNQEVPALAIHPASAGEGLNFQKGGHHLAWFGIQWNPAMHWQTIGRLARSGQRHSVMVHRILAKASKIERRMAEALVSKSASEKRFFDAVVRSL
jgi:SNF2 family DNA or RNA helicase